jgi:hypothetical protein
MSFAFPRTLECPAENCFCSVPRPNCATWWERVGGFNFRTMHRMSVSMPRRIYSFVGGALRAFAYRLPHPHCRYIPGSNPSGSAPFHQGRVIHLRGMLASSTLRAHGVITLGACVSVATTLPLHVNKGCTYPSGTGSPASTYRILYVLLSK